MFRLHFPFVQRKDLYSISTLDGVDSERFLKDRGQAFLNATEQKKPSAVSNEDTLIKSIAKRLLSLLASQPRQCFALFKGINLGCLIT